MKLALARYQDQESLFAIDSQSQTATPIFDDKYSSQDPMQLLIRSCQKIEELALPSPSRTPVPLDQVQLRPPLTHPQKILCVGRNYREHAGEMGADVPDIPVIFNKLPSSLIGPGDAIQLPRISDQVDYEAELVVVIGKPGRQIAREQAPHHVFGYTCGNDISARDWQKGRPGGQWLLGKTFDSFAPLGPWIVTRDELPQLDALQIQLRLNGQVMQQAKFSELIFDVPFLIEHLSKFVTLQPGDLIFTGTPSGVGAARTPPVFLKPGDELQVEIEQIGQLGNPVASAD